MERVSLCLKRDVRHAVLFSSCLKHDVRHAELSDGFCDIFQLAMVLVSLS
jgi:hypothetical protein